MLHQAGGSTRPPMLGVSPTSTRADSRKMALVIEQFPCRSDNFGVLIHDPVSGLTAAIDAPEEEAIVLKLQEKNWKLDHILVTHHHRDHIEGNLPLKEAL